MLEKHANQTLADTKTGQVRFTRKYREKNGRCYALLGYDLHKPFRDEQAAKNAIAKLVVSRLTDEECNALAKFLEISGVLKDS